MSDFFSKRLSGLKPYVPGEQPKNIRNLVKLNTNENPFPPSPEAVKAGKAALKKLNLYSDPDASALKKAIADSLNAGRENVAVFNGSDEALAFFFAGFCDDGAVINDITYGFYKVFARFYGVETTVVPLKEDFTVSVEDYADKKGTVFIANPNAPTGIALGTESIAALSLQNPARLVVVDEAYVDFGAESAVKILKDRPNVAVVRTFSKSRSLAGGRLGFVISSEEIIADLEKVRNSFNPYNVNSVTLAMGEAAIKDRKYFEMTRQTVIKNRAVLTAGLEKLGFKVLDSRANFIFASPPDKDGKRFYSSLRERGVLVRYWDEGRLSAFCRITVGDEKAVGTLIACAEEIYGR